MAETRTPRMRLVHWSEGTDSPQRVDFNETFLSIESLAAIDQQGTRQNRPVSNKAGMYYFATDEGILYRSDGVAWAVVGSSTLSQLVRSARTDSVALTVQAIASQTADLLRYLSSAGATYLRMRSNGDYLVGPLRVLQAARTTTTSDTVPTDSAVTVDNASTSTWGVTAKSTTGNTAGSFRSVRGTSTVFSVAPDGTVSTPAVVLGSAPSAGGHATTKTYVDNLVSQNVYDINGANISGVLSVARGGTSGTTEATARAGIGAAASATSIATGAGLSGGGNLTASRTLSVVFPTANTTHHGGNVGTSDVAARYDHSHDLAGEKIIGVLPIANGGTAATTAAGALSTLGAAASARTIATGDGLTGGGNLTANRTLSVTFAGNGSATTVARSDHGHALTDANLTGTLPINQGGTNATTAAGALTSLGAAPVATTFTAGAGLSGGGTLAANRTFSVDYAGNGTANSAARSDHTHDINSSTVTGTLSVAGGGTGVTSITSGNYVVGSTASALSSKTPAQVRADIDAATSGHGHSLNDANLTGVLGISQGGTGATSVAAARTALSVPLDTNQVIAGTGLTGGGTLAASRTINVTFAGSGSASTSARSDHGHALTDANVTGTLPVSQGGTGATSTSAARTALAVPVNTTQVVAGNGLTGGGTLAASRTLNVDFAGTGSANTVARSNHTHNLTDATILGSLPWAQFPDIISLGAAVDLNDYTTTAIYHQSANAGAANGTNYPTNLAGLLDVKASSSMVYQTYYSYATSAPRTFRRTKYATAWGAWVEIMDNTDLANLVNVYAARIHGHSLTDSNLTGTLPINQGGTGATTQAAARSALAVPSTSIAVTAGAGLSGGGTLAASRTLQVVFEGSGSKNTSARSDHGHSLTDANVTGILPVAQGGTGAATPWEARAGIEAAYVSHGHALTDSNITGILPVTQGGTGRSTITAGTYLRGNGTTTVTMRQPADVLSDIGALADTQQSFKYGQGMSAAGWNVYSGGQIITPLKGGGVSVSLEFMLTRSGVTFTQTSSYMTHGYTDTLYKPNHTGGIYFPIMIDTGLGWGYINFNTGEFMARANSGTITVASGTRISGNITWASI